MELKSAVEGKKRKKGLGQRFCVRVKHAEVVKRFIMRGSIP